MSGARGDYAQAWLGVKAASVPERTWINQEGQLRNHLVPVLGDRQLSAIRPEDVRLLVADLTTVKHLQAATVRPVYFLLRRLLATAVADGLIARNPCVEVELPAEEQGDERLFLAPSQLVTLADSIDPRYRALILTAGYSGLRAGELCALTLDRGLFLRRRLAVVDAHSEVRGRLVTKSTKTRRPREVPIPAALVEMLTSTWRAIRPQTGSCSRPRSADRSIIAISIGAITRPRWGGPSFRPD